MSKTKFRASKKGQKVSIELTVKEYQQLLEDLEELNAIRAYDSAKRSRETPIRFEEAVRQIEQSRK